MTTNVQNIRPSSRPSNPVVVATTPTRITALVGGVAGYDRDVDTRPAASMADDRVPAKVSSSGSMLTWIIGAIVLILWVYLLLPYAFS